jgi:hypothetical protein
MNGSIRLFGPNANPLADARGWERQPRSLTLAAGNANPGSLTLAAGNANPAR